MPAWDTAPATPPGEPGTGDNAPGTSHRQSEPEYPSQTGLPARLPGWTRSPRSAGARRPHRWRPERPQNPCRSSSAQPAWKADRHSRCRSARETSTPPRPAWARRSPDPGPDWAGRTERRSHPPARSPTPGERTPPESAPQSPPAPCWAAGASRSHAPPRADSPAPHAARPAGYGRCCGPRPRRTRSATAAASGGCSRQSGWTAYAAPQNVRRAAESCAPTVPPQFPLQPSAAARNPPRSVPTGISAAARRGRIAESPACARVL